MTAFTLKLQEADARERLRAFWDGSSLGRPALGITVAVPGDPGPLFDDPTLSQKALDLLPEWHAWNIRSQVGRLQYKAETMPGFAVGWGSFLVTLAVLAGGDYTYHDSAWILPIPDLYDHPLPAFNPEHPIAQQLTACYQRVMAEVGDAGFVTPPLMMDGLSTLSMFRGPDQLCLDMIEQPATVKAWTAALTTMYIDIYEYYYQLIGAGYSLCFFGPFAEGRSEGVQCDFAVNLSPAMYKEFVYPDLRRVTDYFDAALYHLDGTCQMRFLEHLRAMPKLNGIQWNPETTAGSPADWLDALQEIRRQRFSLMIWTSPEEAVAITRALGPDGLFLQLPTFTSEAAAEAAIRDIEYVCGK